MGDQGYGKNESVPLSGRSYWPRDQVVDFQRMCWEGLDESQYMHPNWHSVSRIWPKL